jgi:hypothetical protein
MHDDMTDEDLIRWRNLFDRADIIEDRASRALDALEDLEDGLRAARDIAKEFKPAAHVPLDSVLQLVIAHREGLVKIEEMLAEIARIPSPS